MTSQLCRSQFNLARLIGDDLVDFDTVTAISSRGGNDTTDIENTVDFLLETIGVWQT